MYFYYPLPPERKKHRRLSSWQYEKNIHNVRFCEKIQRAFRAYSPSISTHGIGHHLPKYHSGYLRVCDTDVINHIIIINIFLLFGASARMCSRTVLLILRR